MGQNNDSPVVTTVGEQTLRDRYIAALAGFLGLFLGVILTGMVYSGFLKDAKRAHSAVMGCIPASGNEEIIISYRLDGDLGCERRMRNEVRPGVIPKGVVQSSVNRF